MLYKQDNKNTNVFKACVNIRLLLFLSYIMTNTNCTKVEATPTPRQSGIELLRLVAMLMILLLHANFLSLGKPEAQSIQIDPGNSFFRILAEHFCIVAVNVYVFISGWFGIHPKIESALNLITQVITYSLLGIAICIFWSKLPISKSLITEVLVIGKNYWFVVSYLLLYIMSPVLNAFIENSNKVQIKMFLIAFFVFEFIYGWIFNLAGFAKGYSTISFIGLYILARYLRIFGSIFDCFSISFCIKMYSIISLFMTVLVYSQLYYWGKFIVFGRYLIDYNCPFVVISSLFLFFAFQKFKFSNHSINYLSSSAFAIYLIHTNPHLWPFYKKCVEILNASLGFWGIFTFALFVMLICILIDIIRKSLTPIDLICTLLKTALNRFSCTKQQI